jgi:hypothetical protein
VRRWLKRLLLALVALAALYLLAANVFLNTPMASWAVNRRPQRFRVSWSSAWSIWPGVVRVRGLQLRGRGSNDVAWTVIVERGHGWIALPALLGRRFVVSSFHGEGVRSSVLRGPGVGVPPEPDKPGERPRPPWGIHIEGIDLTDVREVGYNGFRLTGQGGHVEGSFAVVFGREFRLDGGRLVMPHSRLWMGPETLAQDLDVDSKLSFAPYAPRRHPGLEGWDFFTGSLAAHGQVPPDLPFLIRSGLPGAGKPGRLVADLQVEKGRLVPGSRAELIAGAAAGSSPAFMLTAEVNGGSSPGLLLGLQAQGLQAGRIPGRPPIFQCAAITATVQSPLVQLRRLFVTTREVRVASNLSASPPLAGDVRVESLKLDAPGSRATMRLTVDRALGRLDVAGLLRQELDIEGLQAQGVSVQLDLAPPQTANPRSAGKPWAIRLANAKLTGIRDFGIDELRLAGPSSAEASFSYDPDGNLGVERASFTLPDGTLLVSGKPAARRLALKLQTHIEPLVLGSTPGLTFLRQVSGSADVRAAISSFGFLAPYLRKAALKLQGEGNLDAAVRLDAGRVRAGSRLAIRQARVSAAFLDTLASGSGTVTLAVDPVDPQARPAFRVHLDRFGFADLRQAGHPVYVRGVRGRGLEMKANAAGGLDLAGAVPDFDASLAMTDAEVPDLRVYNALLPEGAGFAILSGAGRVGLRLALSTATGKTRGTAFLTSNAARVQVQDLDVQGRVALQVPFSSPDLQNRHFDLDGVQVTLDRVVYGEGGQGDEARSRSPDWWARARIADGAVVWGQPLSLHAAGAVEMRDSGPLIALFSERNRLVKWFDQVLSVEGVTAQGVLRIENGVVAIESFQAKGGNLEVHSRMRFSKTRKAGDLLVRYGRLVAGVELLDGKRDFKLIRAQEWFDSRAGARP